MSDRYTAAICARGHVINGMLNEPNHPKSPGDWCESCGAPVLVACGNCSAPLLGYAKGYVDFSFQVDNFCKACGKPYSWAGREAIVHHLENMLLYRDNLDDAGRREVGEQLAVLAATDISDNSRIAAGERIKQLAPKAWNLAAPILTSLLTAGIRMKLGLPPA